MPLPPARRATVKDVAARAGVAPMTVSYSFNHPERVATETRERVLAAAADLGYQPDQTARALRSGRTGQLGVVVGEHLSYVFDDPQAVQFLAGVSDVCVEDDLGMVLIPTQGCDGDVNRVTSAAVDAYVLWTTTSDDPVVDAVARSGRPGAIQGGPIHPGLACVGPDDHAAAAEVARAAALDGVVPWIVSFPLDRTRQAGLLRGADLPDDPDDPAAIPYPVTAARLAGFRRALVLGGHDWADVPVAVVSRNEQARGAEAVEALLAAHPAATPVVVLTMSDELALGARRALDAAGRPGTVTGWDGSLRARRAGVWSVEASMREQGRACARAALAGQAGVHQVPWHVVPPVDQRSIAPGDRPTPRPGGPGVG